MTQSELATRVGTTQSAIARLERGAASPGFARVHELVNACGFELRTSLEPTALNDADADAELGALRRNLALSYDERLANVVAMQRLTDAGRVAVKAKRAAARQNALATGSRTARA